MAHVDVSKADKMRGHKWTYVFAGAKKAAGNPHEPLTAEVRQDLQEDVDRIYEMFVATVARNRNMDAAAVRATEADTFMGEEARSEEHTSELQSLTRISYAVFCLTKNKKKYTDS